MIRSCTQRYEGAMSFKHTISPLFEKQEFPDDAFFIDAAFSGRAIVVYGAGESFHYFKEIVMRQYGYAPSVVLDRKFAVGDTFEGVPAFPLDAYHPSVDEKENAIAVVCLGRQSQCDEVAGMLREKGYRNILSLLDIYEIHNPFVLPEELGHVGFRFYLTQRERIESCLDILADDRSRDVYISCLQTHMRRKPVAIPQCARYEQYTPHDIRLARGASRLVYCGVSVGEMARVLGDLGTVQELVCFEPDPNHFRLAAEYLAMHHQHVAGRVAVMPCAVYRHEALEPFTYSDTSFGSRILASGESRIQTVTIDHVLPGFDPSYIIMDVEGAEPDALKGSENTIRLSRPDLAICVYHAPHHLWEIPLYLNSLNIGYKFYLRNYTGLVSETVLYATK